MYKMFRFSFLQIIFILYVTEIFFCIVYAGDDETKQEKKTVIKINLIDELHSLYKDAIENDQPHVTRRFLGNDGHTHYTLHVQKLKEVDGVKTHNLRAEGRSRNQDPIIYINNPVEAGLPNPFLSIEEFKNAMVERIQNQKKEFSVQNYPAYKPFNAKIFDKVKKHVKQEVELGANTEFPTKPSSDKLKKKSTHKGNHKANQKRKPKHFFGRATKSTTKPRIKITTTLSDEFVTFKKSKTITETIAKKSIINPTTETRDNKVNKKRKPKYYFSRANKSTTKPRRKAPTTLSDELVIFEKNKTITETVAKNNIKNPTTESSVDEKINTELTADGVTTLTKTDENTTTESTASDVIITTTADIDDKTTETTADEITTTEMVTNEVTTETVAIVSTDATTEKTTAKTKRTRQAKPYVFMGY